MPKTKNFMNLTGHRYGRLIVVEYAGACAPTAKTKQHQWNCKCDCGQENVIVRGNNLRNGQTASCGCLQRERAKGAFQNITDQRFGKLVARYFVERKHGHAMWWCRCDCGTEKTISATNMRKGLTTSCGCYQRVARRTHGLSGTPGYKTMRRQNPVERLKHGIGCLVRHALKSRGISKNGIAIFKHLSYTAEQLKAHLESLWEPWMSWSNYGGRANNKKKTWHIDHIKPQSSFNFTSVEDGNFQKCWALENLRPLEKIANMKKGCKNINTQEPASWVL